MDPLPDQWTWWVYIDSSGLPPFLFESMKTTSISTFNEQSADKSHVQVSLCPVCALFLLMLYTARKRSLGQDNIFTPVCHSVPGGSGPGGSLVPGGSGLGGLLLASYWNAFLLFIYLNTAAVSVHNAPAWFESSYTGYPIHPDVLVELAEDCVVCIFLFASPSAQIY